ncbi:MULTISPECIES: YlbF family regulator [unclassified Virgibacillus]|uniref:YlbF family regulator n=1 Tax=unclassified Virgibacillus TaxID=2620237 RepID=UPI0024DE4C25|nr:YlbF family regulator [Virgibacillus sp. LDC-1]
MIATLEFVDVLDRAEQLGKMVMQSEEMKAYKNARRDMDGDIETQKLITAFNNIKGDYEDIQRFGRYHPDYNEIMKKVRAAKRAVDMNDKVAAFKVTERNLQRLLDELSQIIALGVSEQIKVPIDGAALTDSGCGCGSGGGCGCQAS